MSEPFGSVKHGAIAASKLLPMPLAAGRRVRAQIDDYVVDGASRTAHEFGFLVGLFLVVHTSKRTSQKTEGCVQLEHVGIEAMLNELFAAPGTCEIASVVLDLFLPDEEGPSKCRFDEFHK